jgi:hypothetical protein
MKRRGLFNLQTPLDLLAKAEHDLGRLRADPTDAYAAFDFFVAVRHLPDWLHPSDSALRKSLFAKHVELRIARHIADGSKHFEATHAQNIQVAGTSADPAAYQSGAFQASAFQNGGLIVELDSRDPDTAAIGTRIGALELAEKVFTVARAVVV